MKRECCPNEPGTGSEREEEFTDEQIERLDEIESAAYEFIKVMAETDDIPFDMNTVWSIIYNSATTIEETLERRVRVPTRVTFKDGTTKIIEYSDDGPKNINEVAQIDVENALFNNPKNQ